MKFGDSNPSALKMAANFMVAWAIIALARPRVK